MENLNFSIHISAILSISNHLNFLGKVREFSGNRKYPENSIKEGTSHQGMSTELAQISIESIERSLQSLQRNSHPKEEIAWIKATLFGLLAEFEKITGDWDCPTNSVTIGKKFRKTIETLAIEEN